MYNIIKVNKDRFYNNENKFINDVEIRVVSFKLCSWILKYTGEKN